MTQMTPSFFPMLDAMTLGEILLWGVTRSNRIKWLINLIISPNKQAILSQNVDEATELNNFVVRLVDVGFPVQTRRFMVDDFDCTWCSYGNFTLCGK